MMEQKILTFENDAMPGIEKYFAMKQNYYPDLCEVRKDTVLTLISIYREDKNRWVITPDIVDFIKMNDQDLYSKYDNCDSMHQEKYLIRSVGQNLQLTSKLGFIKKDGFVSQYRLKDEYRHMIDEIEKCVKGTVCGDDKSEICRKG
ncbi:MAG: hypothetical protein ABIG84_02120 [archaeon]